MLLHTQHLQQLSMRWGDSAEVSTDGRVSISSVASTLHNNEEMGQLS